MSSRERLLKVLNNETPDQIPWSSLITKYFLTSQEEKYRRMDPVDFLLEIGADATPWISFKTESKNVNVTTYVNGKKFKEVNDNWLEDVFDYMAINSFRKSDNCIIEKAYEGFGGILTSKYIYKADAATVFLTDFMIKSAKDYSIFEKMIMDIKYIDISDDYKNIMEKIGERGLPIVSLHGTPMLELLEFYMGIENFFYNFTDHKYKTENLLYIMKEKYEECYKFYSNMSCKAIISVEDTGSTLYSPEMFGRYIKPVLRSYRDIVKSSGKIHFLHSCGHLKALVPMLKEIETDCIESVTPPPIGSIEVSEIKKQMPGVCIMGGIPAYVFSYSLGSFGEFMKDLILKAKGTGNFILSSGDSTPNDAKIENLKAIPELIDMYGKY